MFSILPEPLQPYLLSAVLLLAAPIVRRVIRMLFNKIFLKVAERTATDLDDALIKATSDPLGWAVFSSLIFASLMALEMAPVLFRVIWLTYLSILGIIVTWFIFRWINGISDFFESRARETESQLDDQLIPVVRKSLKIFIVVVAGVVILQNLGYNISGLIAGLGIGGLAFALAAQESLSNLFGSLMIFLDKPFRVGDFVQIGSISGSVEDVGFRSTRVRTFEKTLMTIPNSTVAKSAIDNFSRRDLRRVRMSVGLTYDTPPESMKRAVEIIREIVSGHEQVDSAPPTVAFNEMGDSALKILVQYFVNTTDWFVYLETLQEINLAILDAFGREGLSIAFPTQTLHVITGSS